MKKIATIILAGTAAVFMSACGGGGGSTPSEPNTNVYDLRAFIDIPNYTILGTGTISSPAGTINVTGSYWSQYNGPGEVNGTHAHEAIMTLTDGDITVEDNFYAETYMGIIFSTYNRLTDISCELTPLILDSLTPVPSDAQVGYQSGEVTLQCSDGSYVTNSIELNDAGGGNAIFSYTSNTYEVGGALRSTQTANIEITPNIRIVDAEISGSIPGDGITFTLYSTSIEQSLDASFIGKTRYFATSIDTTGYRSYAADESYTGSILVEDTLYDLSGSYEISNNVLTLYRTSPGATTLTSTYVGEEAGGLVFNTISPDLNGGNVFQTFSFKTEAERDAYVESLAL